ncbi:unnamed protein product [Sphenostylis stenocarpa]|uniref:Uncharacterized protein n=1 Tax=Sphenostylis stenocarpa TaxID=92480 RepID=A0AA86VX69_9FABA|nr:unnamed protein product [Sphenostylis stenocarpa]
MSRCSQENVSGRETLDFEEHSATALFGAVSVTVGEKIGTSETVTETRMELNGGATKKWRVNAERDWREQRITLERKTADAMLMGGWVYRDH